jgi:outer membrane protein TolC
MPILEGRLRMLRFAVLGGLLAIAAAAWGQEAAVPVSAMLTLDQAVVLALQNNRQVHNAALEVGKKTDQVAAARTQLLPAFNVYVLESYLLPRWTLPSSKVPLGRFPAPVQFRPKIRPSGQSGDRQLWCLPK